MARQSIIITEYDKKRLGRSVNHELRKEIDQAQVVPPQDIPSDIITMNSRFKLTDLDSGEEMIYTLVFPEEADIFENKISIFAPMGMALIGYRVGDIVEWPVPSGILRIKVLEILYQPEASGDYTL